MDTLLSCGALGALYAELIGGVSGGALVSGLLYRWNGSLANKLKYRIGTAAVSDRVLDFAGFGTPYTYIPVSLEVIVSNSPHLHHLP